MSRGKIENPALCQMHIYYFFLQDEVNIYGATRFYYSKHRAEGAFMKSAGNTR